MRLKFFDTTLRDGEQAPENTMNPGQKLKIAKDLESLGVEIIEAGFPISSKKDFKACELTSKEVKKSAVFGFARCKKEDIDSVYNSVKFAKDYGLHIFIASSDLHIAKKLNMTTEQVLKKVEESLVYSSKFFKRIHFGLEDSTRADREFLCQLIDVLEKFNIEAITIADTVGMSLPSEIKDLVLFLKKKYPNQEFSIHCHNDLGLATANTLSAIEAGVGFVQTTINGIGERSGNTAFEEIIASLLFRKEKFDREIKINTNEIANVSKKVYEILKRTIPYEKAIVGINSFRHEAGIHVRGLQKDENTYEFVKPSVFGFKRKIVFGKHSSKKRGILRFFSR